MRKYMQGFFLLFLFNIPFLLQGQVVKISVDPSRVIAPVSEDFWGANFLYWIEDDESLKDGRLAAQLKEMGCSVLRYPGGTVADNFDWKTATLNDTNMFPYQSGDAESDFGEFMKFCSQVGAEPMLVVNTQWWFLHGKTEEGARCAADWVGYCKDRGYKVRYWEIGNETYWHPVMTASEYGALVAVYAKAMKAVDPDIIVSANGHWDVDMVGTKERTDPAYIARLFEMAREGQDFSGLLKDKRSAILESNIRKGDRKWWNDVLEMCGDQIDMISVHWYFHQNILNQLDAKLPELRDFVSRKMHGKPYKWCLSEYNCNTDNDAGRVAGLAEGLGRFLNFGFDVATFWPMRIGGMEHRSMFSLSAIDPQYPYQLFELFRNTLKGNMVQCTSSGDVCAFAAHASGERGELNIVLSGASLKQPVSVCLALPSGWLKEHEISAKTYSAVVTGKRTVRLNSEDMEIIPQNGQDTLTLQIRPDSFVMLSLQ